MKEFLALFQCESHRMAIFMRRNECTAFNGRSSLQVCLLLLDICRFVDGDGQLDQSLPILSLLIVYSSCTAKMAVVPGSYKLRVESSNG